MTSHRVHVACRGCSPQILGGLLRSQRPLRPIGLERMLLPRHLPLRRGAMMGTACTYTSHARLSRLQPEAGDRRAMSVGRRATPGHANGQTQTARARRVFGSFQARAERAPRARGGRGDRERVHRRNDVPRNWKGNTKAKAVAFSLLVKRSVCRSGPAHLVRWTLDSRITCTVHAGVGQWHQPLRRRQPLRPGLQQDHRVQ